ncbi:permease glycerol uptake facilitator domain containing protein [Nitzschia inconspicua]|uniref:Permease glycerol uptake facilitator domain containing protein n=1 Tax=Nitzschia inconspicua TaxID=303405 RepID=A0A9K3KYI1_9STRA|nr:permease glycerol uptake facilitator domain containing protein [Nitzschia inconspicua]
MSTYVYPLGAKVLSEFTGMTLTIFFGESIIANELLPSTKGHGMGFLAVALGFGLAFGVNIAFFGLISAHLNPAMFLFLAILGKVSWVEFVCCSLADLAGAFVGAVFVYIFYLPHFGFTSLPLPVDGSLDTAARYLEGPTSYETNAGRLASAFGPASKPREGTNLRKEIKEMFHFPNDQSFLDDSSEFVTDEQRALLQKMEIKYQRRVRQNAKLHAAPSSRIEYFRANSANVATLLHENDPQIEFQLGPRRHSAQIAGLLHDHDGQDNLESQVTKKEFKREEEVLLDEEHSPPHIDTEPTDETIDKEVAKAYKAALQADARAKLAIFATRPSIFNRPYNLFQEAVCTLVLVFGAEMFHLRKEIQSEAAGSTRQDGPFMQSLFLSLFITMLVLGPGGVTGLAANPARDLGPRLAHFVLPIAGKGTSEWNYGLIVPIFGPFCGAAIGAGLFMLIELLYDSYDIAHEDTTEL